MPICDAEIFKEIFKYADKVTAGGGCKAAAPFSAIFVYADAEERHVETNKARNIQTFNRHDLIIELSIMIVPHFFLR